MPQLKELKQHKIMSALDLRLENLVYNQHGEIHSIRSNDFQAWMAPKMDMDYGFYGIPLTSEILKKIGFEITGVNDSIYSLFLNEHDKNEMQRQRIDVWSDDVHGMVELCRAGVCFKRVPCQYLHQFQNLYHALTGKELPADNIIDLLHG